MAWTYADYGTYKRTAFGTYLTRLELHMQEVRQRIDTEMASDGKLESSHALQRYYDRLADEYRDAEADPRFGNAGGISRVRMVEG